MSDTNGLNQGAVSWSVAVPKNDEKTFEEAKNILNSLPHKYPALEAFINRSQDDDAPHPDMY